jgi:hypothetical protein
MANPPSTADFGQLLTSLAAAQVDYVIIGGYAAALLGVPLFTNDLDILYARGMDNLERLASALEPHNPYLRGLPPGLPFKLDATTLTLGLNFTLTTTIGPIDLMGEIAGLGNYDAVRSRSIPVTVYGIQTQVICAADLLAAKRAVGRTKDHIAISMLESLINLNEAQEPFQGG